MNNWSSFEQDHKYAQNWRNYLENQELDEGVWDKISSGAKEKFDKAKEKVGQAKAGAKKGAAGAEKARQAATGTWDWIANFLSGTPEDEDHSHLKMPTPERPTSRPGGAEAGEERSTETGDDTGGAAPDPRSRVTGDAPTQDDPTQDDKVISSDPQSAQSQSQRSPEQEKLAQWAAGQRRLAVMTADSGDRNAIADFKKEQEKWSEEQWKAWHASPAINESQTYDRWKVLSGIKKKVI